MSETTGCPCTFPELEPCSSSCTCREPSLSGGCQRCARYGSYEQRLNKARWLLEQDALRARLRAALRWRTVGVDGMPEMGQRVLVRNGSRIMEASLSEANGRWLADGLYRMVDRERDSWVPVPEEQE